MGHPVVPDCRRSLVADGLHCKFESGTLDAGGRKMGQARQTAEVAVEVAGKLECCGGDFGERGGLQKASLLLVSERLVVILPSGEDFEAGLGSASSEG